MARNVNECIGYPRKKKKNTETRYNWVSHYPRTLSLRPVVAATTGKVEQAVCRFCEHFQREGNPVQSDELSLILNRHTRSPAKSVAIFDKFCRDNIERHHNTQHKTKWEEYQNLPKNTLVRDSFFSADFTSTILAYASDKRGFCVVVPASIISVIQRLIREDPVEVTDSSGSTVTLEFSVFDGLVEYSDGFILHVGHKKQFDTIIRCIVKAASFRAVADMFAIFSHALSNGSLGHVTQEVIAKTVRYVVAINLTALRAIMEHVWGLSILVDGATHASEAYLDVRLSFECNRKLHNVHFLAIPTGERPHTAITYAELVLDALTNVLGSCVLPKIIGVATDGAATMLGCRQGFVTRMKRACADVGGTGIVGNWCGSHQLNLVVRDFLEVFDAFSNFRSTLAFEITFTHTHESVKHVVGSCPEYVKTRWNSIHDTCFFLSERYEELVKLQSEKGRPHSSNTWWLCCFVISDLTRSIKICFARLQGKIVTFAEQTRALSDLRQIFCNMFEDNSNGGVPVVDETKTELVICASSPFAGVIYELLPVLDRHQLVLAVMDAVTVLIQGIQNIQIEVLTETCTDRITSPAEVIDCDDSVFSSLVTAHRSRLREHFGPTILTDIWTQRKNLRDRCRLDAILRGLVDNTSRKAIDVAWNDVNGGKQYTQLSMFVLGMSSIPPGTHTVEGDFSDLKRITNMYRRQLSNHALEGHLQAPQYFALLELASSVGISITDEDGSDS